MRQGPGRKKNDHSIGNVQDKQDKENDIFFDIQKNNQQHPPPFHLNIQQNDIGLGRPFQGPIALSHGNTEERRPSRSLQR
jgi:hypothetical protein